MFPSTPAAIIRDFLKLPYAISGSLECVVVVDDWKTVDMVIPDANFGRRRSRREDEEPDFRDADLGRVARSPQVHSRREGD